MTRKDYELIAAALKDVIDATAPAPAPLPLITRPSPQQEGAKKAAGAVALALQEDNPRFDRVRFLKACGVV